MGMKIKQGDQVVVISGKDKGKAGSVLRTDREKSRVYVEGLNIIKRHQRPSPANPGAQAGVIEKEGPIHVSNVALIDPKDKRPTRVRIKREDGKRYRVAARSNTQID